MSSIDHTYRLFNLERGRVNEEEEEEETGDVISIVCCNGIELVLRKSRPSSRVGNSGIEVRFGQNSMLKEERH
jgi:hypothetical protein